jgi:hypothetical protein
MSRPRTKPVALPLQHLMVLSDTKSLLEFTEKHGLPMSTVRTWNARGKVPLEHVVSIAKRNGSSVDSVLSLMKGPIDPVSAVRWLEFLAHSTKPGAGGTYRKPRVRRTITQAAALIQEEVLTAVGMHRTGSDSGAVLYLYEVANLAIQTIVSIHLEAVSKLQGIDEGAPR